jgi:hypothetical protein
MAMAITVEELEKRLAQVEQEITRLRQLLEKPLEETPAQRGARMLREADANQAEIAAGWARAMEQMGISGEPVGHEKLRAMIEECGIKPEDNEFSREIIAMREE